jgi:hypothetical protein
MMVWWSLFEELYEVITLHWIGSLQSSKDVDKLSS